MTKTATLLAILFISSLQFAFINAVVEQTATFQHGVNGWWGGASVDISEGPQGPGPLGSWNQDGSTYADGAVDWCVGLLHNNPSFQYDIAMLIKFGFLKESLPAGAQVVSAKMSLTIYPEGENIRLIGRYLLQPWLNVSGPIGSNVGVGWRFRNTSENTWAALGATGEGTDLAAGIQAIFPPQGTLIAHEDQWVTVDLDRDIVQSWVSNNDALNYGMRIQADTPLIHSRVTQHQREVDGTWRPITKRPRLEIVYTLDSNYIPPPKAAAAPVSNSVQAPVSAPSGNQVSTPINTGGNAPSATATGGSPSAANSPVGTPGSASARSDAPQGANVSMICALLLIMVQLCVFLL